MHDEVRALLQRPEFPRASAYDPAWVLANQMGPNALWLVEWLCQSLALAPGMRVLDLGCGRALTSVFLARERGVRVWAGDLWVGPDANWERVVAAGVGDLVCPQRLEAHALPFPRGFFDAVVSIDAYTYFGTDDLYLGYLAGFVRPGGLLGVIVPGLTHELDAPVPPHLTRPQANGKVFWEPECACFHSPAWWQAHWSRCAQVTDVRADLLPAGWRHWRDFERAVELAGAGHFPSDAEALDADAGRTIGLVRLTARRTDHPSENRYDPSIGVRVGIDA
jgi:SAM-dependent methyltransferase